MTAMFRLMKFDITKTFEDNISQLKEEAESIDADCAAILFEHLDILISSSPNEKVRETIKSFNTSVLESLEQLEGPIEDAK